MKTRFSKRTMVMAVVIAILMIAVTGLGVMAASNYTKSVPATVTVVANDPNLGLYSDSACTTPITSISFGDINQGATGTAVIYIRNDGNVDMASVQLVDNDTTDFTVTGCDQSLTQGSIAEVDISLTVSPTATTGTGLDPQLVFNCTY